MQKPSIVPKSVHGKQGVKVLAVLPYEDGDVYCLTVPEFSCFAIEGGIIVHNCYDESRYFLMTPVSGRSSAEIQGV